MNVFFCKNKIRGALIVRAGWARNLKFHNFLDKWGVIFEPKAERKCEDDLFEDNSNAMQVMDRADIILLRY